MKILVTGAKGFIGSYITNCLRELLGFQVHTIDLKDGSDILWADLPKVNAIFHLAAKVSSINSVYGPIEDFETNATGTLRILEHARKCGASVIYASSCKIYPAANGGRTPYGASKLTGDIYCQEYAATYGVPVFINRLSTVYGPGQNGSPESGWLTWFIKAAKEDLPITIYGDGMQVRDPVWINDVADLFLKQLLVPKIFDECIYDVGSGLNGAVNLLDVVGKLEELRGSKMDVSFAEPRPSDLGMYISQIHDIPDWYPTVFPMEGIERLWRL